MEFARLMAAFAVHRLPHAAEIAASMNPQFVGKLDGCESLLSARIVNHRAGDDASDVRWVFVGCGQNFVHRWLRVRQPISMPDKTLAAIPPACDSISASTRAAASVYGTSLGLPVGLMDRQIAWSLGKMGATGCFEGYAVASVL
jgi:hypothetical protein